MALVAILPGVWAPWERAASASPGGKSRELHAAFFPEHLLMTSAALTCYMSLCVPQSPVMRAHRTSDGQCFWEECTSFS